MKKVTKSYRSPMHEEFLEKKYENGNLLELSVKIIFFDLIIIAKIILKII